MPRWQLPEARRVLVPLVSAAVVMGGVLVLAGLVPPLVDEPERHAMVSAPKPAEEIAPAKELVPVDEEADVIVAAPQGERSGVLVGRAEMMPVPPIAGPREVIADRSGSVAQTVIVRARDGMPDNRPVGIAIEAAPGDPVIEAPRAETGRVAVAVIDVKPGAPGMPLDLVDPEGEGVVTLAALETRRPVTVREAVLAPPHTAERPRAGDRMEEPGVGEAPEGLGWRRADCGSCRDAGSGARAAIYCGRGGPTA